MPDLPTSPLALTALTHAAVAVGAAIALRIDAAPILGVHPAAKPLKFAVSIALLLATLALVIPRLGTSASMRAGLGWAFSITMIVEMVVIVGQALRGTTSHFNTRTPLDSAGWGAMFVAIFAATVAFAITAWIAIARPLAMPILVATAVRVGLGLIIVAAVTGFAMGGRMRHTVGGADGGLGAPLTNWSREHGDLRIPHFFSLHGLQALPLVALVLPRLTARPELQWLGLGLAMFAWVGVCLVTLVAAFGGRAVRLW